MLTNMFLTGVVIVFLSLSPCFNRLTGKKLDVMNFGSYNYLGFAESSGPCADAVQDIVQKYGVGVCASRQEMGKLWVLTQIC